LSLPTRSQQSKKAADRGADLYRDDRISVTPSWLSVDNSRYSVRTVVKLEHNTLRADPGIAYFFFFGAIILGAYSLYQFTKPELPTLVPWIMLLGSVVIFLYSASVAFASKTRYQVVVTLLDGDKIPIVTGNGKQAQGLLDSLTLAMDWHRNGDILIEAERDSHVRRSVASSSKGQDSGTEKSGDNGKEKKNSAPDESSPVAIPVSQSEPHPSRVVRKLPLIIAAILKGRD